MTVINSNRAVRGPVTAIPLVAGKGVRLVADTENNRVVAEADETVLFETNAINSSLWTNVDLNESISNFERIRVVWVRDGNTVMGKESVEYYTSDINGVTIIGALDADVSNNEYRYFTECVFNNAKYSESRAKWAQYGGSAIAWQTTNSWCHPKRIVGINRISASA